MSVIKGSEADVKRVEWPSVQEGDSTPVERPEPQRQSAPEPQAVPEDKPAVSQSLPEGITPDSTHAYVFEHAREAAAVLRTIVRRDESGDGPLAELTGARLAAVFCIGIGKEIGGKVIGHLEHDEWKAIAEGVVAMREVEHHACMHALELMRRRIEAGEYVELGGERYARQLLSEMGGPGWVVQIVDEVMHPLEPGFEWLSRATPEQVAPFISHEHPQTVALILSQLEPEKAGSLLAMLPERMQADVAYRISTLGEITPNVIAQISESLSRSLRDVMGSHVQPGGPKAVADMLNNSGSSVEKNVLDQMDAQDPQVTESVRNLMFVFEDISKLTDREIQILLRDVDQKDLAIALKAASEEMKDKVLGNISEEVRKKITEEMEFLGPMRLSEVEEVQLRIVQQVRQLEEQGQVTIVRGPGPDLFV